MPIRRIDATVSTRSGTGICNMASKSSCCSIPSSSAAESRVRKRSGARCKRDEAASTPLPAMALLSPPVTAKSRIRSSSGVASESGHSADASSTHETVRRWPISISRSNAPTASAGSPPRAIDASTIRDNNSSPRSICMAASGGVVPVIMRSRARSTW